MHPAEKNCLRACFSSVKSEKAGFFSIQTQTFGSLTTKSPVYGGCLFLEKHPVRIRKRHKAAGREGNRKRHQPAI
jgi:hypothetical protein